MEPPIDRIKLSQTAKDQLTKLKRHTHPGHRRRAGRHRARAAARDGTGGCALRGPYEAVPGAV